MRALRFDTTLLHFYNVRFHVTTLAIFRKNIVIKDEVTILGTYTLAFFRVFFGDFQPVRPNT